MLSDEDFRQVLEGPERPGIELRGGLSLAQASQEDRLRVARLIRSILAMANRRDGGTIIVGVEESNKRFTASGLTRDQELTWNHDDLAAKVAEYADPFVAFDLNMRRDDQRVFAEITVREFELVPVLCKKEFSRVLRNGACYVRPRRKVESVDVPTYFELREVFDLALHKMLRIELAKLRSLGLMAASVSTPSDRELFEQELGNFR